MQTNPMNPRCHPQISRHARHPGMVCRPIIGLAMILTLLTTGGLLADDDDGRKPPARGDRQAFQQRMLAEFDANQDGRLDEDERSNMRAAMAQRGRGGRGIDRQAILKRFDRDGNGRLDEKERQAAMRSAGGRPGGRPGGQRGMLGPAQRARLLERFDEDGDGQLNTAERAAAREAFLRRARPEAAKNGKKATADERPGQARRGNGEFLKRFDKNEDGRLDESERAAARAAFAARRTAGGRPKAQSDGNGTAAKRSESGRVSKQGLLAEFDKDGDGQLNSEERAAAREAFLKKRASEVAEPASEP